MDYIPVKDDFKYMMVEREVESIMILRESIYKNIIFHLLLDKVNRIGNKNIAKYIFWYDEDMKEITEVFLEDE